MFANILHHLTLILLERGQFGGVSKSTLKPHIIHQRGEEKILEKLTETVAKRTQISKKCFY